MATIFSVSNQKGGVGKTTTAVNIAAFCSIQGIKTLLIDLDPQGNATSGIGVDRNNLESSTYEVLFSEIPIKEAILNTEYKNLFILGANSHLAAAEIELIDKDEREFVLGKLLNEIKNDFELIIIDCPPSLGLLTINALSASQKLIIPLQCEYYALEGLGQLLSTFKLVEEKLNPNIEIGGVVLTMADFRTNLTQQVIEEVKNYFGVKTFQTVVPRSVKISEAPSFGKPAIVYETQSRASKAYLEVGREFMERFGLHKQIEKQTEEQNSEKQIPEAGQAPAETTPAEPIAREPVAESESVNQ